ATASTSVATDPSNPNIVFATTGRKDGLYRTTDGGQTWERSSRGLERHPIRIAVAPSDPDVVYAGTQRAGGGDDEAGVYRSVDGGANWFPANNGIGIGQVDDLAIDPRDADVAYAAAERRCESCAYGTALKTVNGGRQWVVVGDGIGTYFYPSSLSISPGDPDVVYAGSPNGAVYRSIDGGQQWSRIDAGLPEAPWIVDVAADPVDPD